MCGELGRLDEAERYLRMAIVHAPGHREANDRLLDLMRIPADTFQIFLAIDQFSGRFGTLLAGMHTVVLGLLTAVVVASVMLIRVATFPGQCSWLLVQVTSGCLVRSGKHVASHSKPKTPPGRHF